MQSEATVSLIDDDTEAREITKRLIESADLPVKIYDSADDFRESSGYQIPGCLVLEVRLHGMSGLQLQELLLERRHAIPVIFVTGYADVPTSVRAFGAKAFAFLEKPVDPLALLPTIHRAVEQDRIYRQKAAAANDVSAAVAKLSPREREVADLIIAGNSMRQISNERQVSLPTLSKHRAKVLMKMNVANDVKLTRRFLAWQKFHLGQEDAVSLSDLQ